MKKRPIDYLKTFGFWSAVTIVILFSIFPFYYAVVTSFTPPDLIISEINLIPDLSNTANYKGVFEQQPFASYIMNSVIVATVVVIISLALGVTAAYALGRVQFKGRSALLLTILGVSMFPQVAVLTGLYKMVNVFGLQESLPGLILANLILTLPFTVWVLTTFMRELPIELEEAAYVDGATPLQLITKVFMPLMWPAMVTTGLLAFIAAWNEFLFALTLANTDETRTIPVAISNISGASQFETPWGNIMAASVIVTVPLIILVLLFQRKIVSGLTAGAVKG